MNIIKVEDEFVSFIREFVCDKLDEFECCEYAPVDASDLRWELLDNDGEDMFDEDGAFAFMQKYPKAALATIDWANFNFGSEELPHLFKSWPTFAERIICFGVENMVDGLPLVQERWDDDEGIGFDHDTVELLKQQVAVAGIEY